MVPSVNITVQMRDKIKTIVKIKLNSGYTRAFEERHVLKQSWLYSRQQRAGRKLMT